MASTYIPGFTPALQSGADAGMARAQTELDRMRALQALAKPVTATPVVPEAASLGGAERLAAFQADAAKIFADANASAEAANRAAEEERAIKNAQVGALSELYTGPDPFAYADKLYNDPTALAAEIERVDPALAGVGSLAQAEALQAKTLADRQALADLGLGTSRAAEAIDRYAEGLNLQPGSRIEGVANSLYKSGVPQELLNTAQFSADPRERKAALDQLQQYVTSPTEQNVNLAFTPSIAGKGIRGDVTVGPNTPIALYDASTGQVVSMGSGFDSARSVAEQAQALSDQMGRKANWQIMVGAPGATDISQFKTVAGELPDKSFMGQFADMALPALGAILLPGVGALGALGSAGAAGVGAAAGSALSGTLQGKSIGDILKSAALSGALAYGGGSLLGGGGSGSSGAVSGGSGAASSAAGTGSALASNAAGALGENVITVLGRAGLAPAIAGAGSGALAGGALNSILNNSLMNTPIDTAAQQPSGGGGGYNAPAAGLDDAGNLITVTGSKLPSSALDSALAAAAAAPGTVNYGDKVYGGEPTLEQQFDDILVEGQRPIEPSLPAAGGAISGGALDAGVLPESTGPDILVEGQRPSEPSLPAAGGAISGGAVNGSTYDPIANEIVVTNKPPAKTFDEIAAGAVAAAAPGLAGTTTTPAAETPKTETKPKSDLDKIIDYLRLAGLGVSTIGSLFGKGGDGGTPINVGRGSLNPVFSAQLPSANLPGLTGGATGPRPASALPQTTQDWYRYGYGPEQSFFNYVPQTAANTSQAYTGYAVGGYAVGGPGDGRDDKIPAMLSDGEYVIDAETVAMLGNGSSKAGAQALDNFRVNVRKHKGRQLAKGQFSVKAKKPEQYLKGRK